MAYTCPDCGETTPEFMKVSTLHKGDCAPRSAFTVPDPLYDADSEERERFRDHNEVAEEKEGGG